MSEQPQRQRIIMSEKTIGLLGAADLLGEAALVTGTLAIVGKCKARWPIGLLAAAVGLAMLFAKFFTEENPQVLLCDVEDVNEEADEEYYGVYADEDKEVEVLHVELLSEETIDEEVAEIEESDWE